MFVVIGGGGGGFNKTLHFILEKGCPNLQTFYPILYKE